MTNIAILSAGEMGAGIGGALVRAGHTVATILEGRGEETRARAAEAGIQEAANLKELLASAEFVFSIVPPSVAQSTGIAVASAMEAFDAHPVYVECNAISPDTSVEIAEGIVEAGGDVVDGGLIGAPPPRDKTRLYVAGQASASVAAIACDEFTIVDLGETYGDASALKMVYASLTKGLNAMMTAALITAARNGVYEPFVEELGASQPDFHKRAETAIPRLPADAGRWVREMEEIASTYLAAGMPADFHRGAAAIMELLASSEFGHETRRTIDTSRTLAGTIRSLSGLEG